MDNKSEELTELKTNTNETANIMPSTDNDTDSTNLKPNTNGTNDKSSKHPSSSTQKTTNNTKKNKIPKKVPVSLKTIRRSSSRYIDRLKENEKTQCAQCLDSRYCCALWIIIGTFLIGVTFMTPISSIIAGWKIHEIFNGYTKDMINTECDGEYDSFVYNGNHLGIHGQTAFIFGIIDFVFLLFNGCCIFGYIYKDAANMDVNVFNIMAGVRLFFIVVWLVYASFFFNSARALDRYCDKNGEFYKDVWSVFKWYIPILSIEVFKDLCIAIVACFGCCVLCCIA